MGDWTDFLIAVPAVVNLLFAFAFGASAGSFMHVLVHRMPQGLSVISPPSRCPTCGHRLRWHENIPVISWLRLRGRCAACGTGIPARYLWSEVGMGALFALAYAVLFLPRPGSFWYPVGEGWWRAQGAAASLPGLLAVWAGLGALVAMTIVDARSFLIPVAIPSWTTVLAFVLWPLAALSSRQVPHPFPLAAPAWPVCVAAMGGLAGLGIGWSLLRAGVLPRSFEDYSDYAEDESDVFADYPHARREMIKELAFVGPAVLLAAVGYAVAPHLPMAGPPRTRAARGVLRGGDRFPRGRGGRVGAAHRGIAPPRHRGPRAGRRAPPGLGGRGLRVARGRGRVRRGTVPRPRVVDRKPRAPRTDADALRARARGRRGGSVGAAAGAVLGRRRLHGGDGLDR